MLRPLRRVGGAACCAMILGVLSAGCGGPSNDPVAREALIRASLKSAAEKSYVAVLEDPGPKAVTFTYAAPDRLRVQQGKGRSAVVFVQVALTGYHSDPKRPGRYTKRVENVPPANNAPLTTVGSLIAHSGHVSRKGDTFRFDVSYGKVAAHLLVDIDGHGRIADADLPVFDSARQVESYKRVTFGEYGRAPAVVAPEPGLVTRG